MNIYSIRTKAAGPGEYMDEVRPSGGVRLVAGNAVEWSFLVPVEATGEPEDITGVTGARLSIFPKDRPATGADVPLLVVELEELTACTGQAWRDGTGAHGVFTLTGEQTAALAALVAAPAMLGQALAVMEVWVGSERRTVGMGPLLVLVDRLGEEPGLPVVAPGGAAVTLADSAAGKVLVITGPPAEAYRIYRRVSGAGVWAWWRTVGAPGNVVLAGESGADVSVEYMVRAVTAGLEGPEGEALEFTWRGAVPAGVVTAVNFTPAGQPYDPGSIEFTVTAVPGASEYLVEIRRTEYDSWYVHHSWDATEGVSATVEVPAGSWSYRLRVVRDGETGPAGAVGRVSLEGSEPAAGMTVTADQLPDGSAEWQCSAAYAQAVRVYARITGTDEWGVVGTGAPAAGAATVAATLAVGVWEWAVVEESDFGYVRESGHVTGTLEVIPAWALGGGGGGVGKLDAEANLTDVADPALALAALNGLSRAGGSVTGALFAAHFLSVGETETGAGTALVVGKAHTVELAAARTLTFTGAAVDGDVVQLMATVTTACVLSFPGCVRNGETAVTVTSLSLPVGVHCLRWLRSGGVWVLFDPIGGGGGGAAADATPYGPLWEDSPQAPTQGALYDYLSTLSSGGDTITARRGGGVIFDDFNQFAISTTVPTGPMGLVSKSANGGSVGVASVPDATAMGVISMMTGTAANGYGSVISETAMIRLGGGEYAIEWRVRIPVLADVTNDFTVRVGLGDNITGGEPSDGIIFRNNNSTGGKFQAACRAGGVETAALHAGTVTAGAWYKLRATINAAANSVTFTIDDADPVTIATNVPNDSSARVTSVFAGITKTAGTTARTLMADYVGLQYKLTR